MKRILILMLCFIFACSSAMAEAASGSALEAYGPAAPGEKLGFAMLNKLYAGSKNSIISPQSLALALGMAAEGAQGDTLAEILEALDVKDVSQIIASLPEELKSANAAFTAPGLVLKDEYIRRLNEAYNAEWFEIDDAVVEKVNAWVQENTDGLIDQLLSEAPGAETAMILINAVAMDAQWALTFDPENTFEENFTTMNGEMPVMMMHRTGYFDYAEKDGVQMIRLPYADSSLEMWIVLPPDTEDGMPWLLNTLSHEGMFYLKSDAQEAYVNLGLPKMDISDENTLSDVLKQLGVETAFGSEADFSGMSETPMCIDSILQKVRVQMDEEGTKAAAATAMIMKDMALREPEYDAEMIVNRPFVFAVSDAETGALCFAGVVENPTEN